MAGIPLRVSSVSASRWLGWLRRNQLKGVMPIDY